MIKNEGLPLNNEYNNWKCGELKVDWKDVEETCKYFDEEDTRSYMKRIIKRFEIYTALHNEGYGPQLLRCDCHLWA